MIDPELQKELRARFNPDGSLLRRHQLRMLEMLKYIDKVCQENNIPYWLSSGTCLGAVRHGGFIPWDDDVDIEMLGKDYDRFVKIMERQRNDRYILHTHKNDSSYVWQFGKFRDNFSILKEPSLIDRDYKYQGLYIDVMPMDYSPSDVVNEMGEFLLRLCLHTNTYNNIVLRKIARSVSYFISFRLIAPIIKLMTRKTDTLHHRFGSPFHKKRDIKDIFPLKEILFEGYKFKIPQHEETYLSKIYGNYMQLPDLNAIKNHSVELLLNAE